MAKKVDDDAIAAFLKGAEDWSREGDSIVRDFKAASDRDAVRAIGRIADLAIGANHHPELTWVYDSLHIVLSTHDVGGLTKKDLHLAGCIDDVLADTPSA
ncbi:MAG: 4a-hydroxytetrahydrobiopterin dehydratase [Sandaracinus sp.]|mgnify:FL=1|nr:4a-hydroxytetrahydrobiopterin dehydratase [Sandaracinus sp.]|tara:strand:- start:1079 stop:1378 length:300 start_codon:yes stop_codon:yes gene_type:complete